MADDAAASEFYVKLAGPKDSQPTDTTHSLEWSAAGLHLLRPPLILCLLLLCVLRLLRGRLVQSARGAACHLSVQIAFHWILHAHTRQSTDSHSSNPPLLHPQSRLRHSLNARPTGAHPTHLLSCMSRCPVTSPVLCQHPNVDEASGSVCLDVINQTWSPMFDLVNVFSVFLPQLLLYPNPADPLNRQAAQLLMKDPTAYQTRVREHVKQHASKDFHMGDDDGDGAQEGEDEVGEDSMEDGETDGTDSADAGEDEDVDGDGDEEDEVLSDCDDLPADEPTEQLELCH